MRIILATIWLNYTNCLYDENNTEKCSEVVGANLSLVES